MGKKIDEQGTEKHVHICNGECIDPYFDGQCAGKYMFEYISVHV